MRTTKYAIVSDQGTAMSETVLTAEEYANPRLKAAAERTALSTGDCSHIEWHDVTDNDYFYEEEA